MYTHWVPKLNENLANLNYPIAEYVHIQRKGRYTTVLLVGQCGQRVGIGQAHQSITDIDNPGVGLRLAWDRAVKEFVHDETVHIKPDCNLDLIV